MDNRFFPSEPEFYLCAHLLVKFDLNNTEQLFQVIQVIMSVNTRNHLVNNRKICS